MLKNRDSEVKNFCSFCLHGAPREKTLGNDFPRSDNLVIALAVSFHFVWQCC